MCRELKKRGLEWVGSTKDDLRAFPEEVKHDIGYALFTAQQGIKPSSAKPLKGFGGATILEIVAGFYKNTYRAVYTVRFEKAIYVLHCFQKKSTHGIKTASKDIRLIKQRLQQAREHYQETYK